MPKIHFNKGRRETASSMPDVYHKHVRVDGVEPVTDAKGRKIRDGWWVLTFIINGWPYSINMPAKDELDAFRKAHEYLRVRQAIIVE